MLAMSLFSRPPFLVKNLTPFRFQGRWLAVSMIAPSYSYPFVTVLMNMLGVLERPKSARSAPISRMPSAAACSSRSPESLESRPMESFRSLLLNFSCRYSTNAMAMFFTALKVSVTGCPSTPSMATPRMSLPFCSLR